MMAALNAGRHEQDAQRKRPLRIVAAALVCAAGVYAYRKLPRSSPQPAQPPPAAPAPPAEPPQQPPTAKPVEEPPTPMTPPLAETPQPPEEPEPASEWTVSGSVYELLTLRPTADAKLAFEDPSSREVFRVRTDARGRYTVKLPRLGEGGYRVSVAARGFPGTYLEEASPPFASRTPAAREEAAYEASQSRVLHVPIFLDQESALEYNLALLPAR
jgi:hypothetical protein